MGWNRLLYGIAVLAVLLVAGGCSDKGTTGNKEKDPAVVGEDTPFLWEGANIYFLLTDRFCNGDTSNDVNFERTGSTAKLRGFEGGDIAGITKKIEEGYFNHLGINVIWLTPVVEQVHGIVDEGTGNTYGYHGYWAKDWTALDPNFGSEADFAHFVETAHNHGIRIMLDVVLNHTGPVTEKDPLWPADWVRTSPKCEYRDYESTVSCTLVENLPDILTESDKEVELPEFLLDKWEKEGRLDEELKELDAFFAATSYPRTPRHYIIKWLVDFIKKFGIDAYRIDTAKHTEAGIWAELYKEAAKAFSTWKRENPEKVLDDNDFFMMGEVYNYMASTLGDYDYGDTIVDFYDNGFNSLINFEFKYDASGTYEELFSKYSGIMEQMEGNTILNYISSHDDGAPFDVKRESPFVSANKLLLCPGSSQVYYGDELARPLDIKGTNGDAALRSFMNWGDYDQAVLAHWQKLGSFRRDHPAIGSGKHKMISREPYFFSRTLSRGEYSDAVVIGLDPGPGVHEIDLGGLFSEGSILEDHYTGTRFRVKEGKVRIETGESVVLLEKKEMFISEVKHPAWSEAATLYEINVRQYTEEGTLKAIEEHLPRLKELGVDILWLMPVYPVGEKNKKGELGSVYAVKDFMAINPYYGDMGDFMSLLNKAHQMGFYVLMDWVPNHTAWDNHLIEEHPEWYAKGEDGSPKRPDEFDWTDVAQLDWSEPGLHEYMLEAMRFWVEKGVDGFRVDQPQHTSKEFWENARVELEKIRPVLLLAENEDKHYLLEKGFDMNYSWELHHLMNRVARGEDDVQNIARLIEGEKQVYPGNVYRTRFLSNHDENTHQGALPARMGDATKAFSVLMFTIPGFPLLYSGQETCNEKALKEFVRDPIEWKECNMADHLQWLIQLKKKNPSLWNGEFGGSIMFLETGNPMVLAYKREKGENSVTVVLNLSGKAQEHELQAGEEIRSLLQAWEYEVFARNRK